MEIVNAPHPLPPWIFAAIACLLRLNSHGQDVARGTGDGPWEEGCSTPLLVWLVLKVCRFTFSLFRLSCSHLQCQQQQKVVAPPHFSPQRKRSSRGSGDLWVFFICPSLVERIRFLSPFLQTQINSLKSSGRRTPATHSHFRSPYTCIGQGVLSGLPGMEPS